MKFLSILALATAAIAAVAPNAEVDAMDMNAQVQGAATPQGETAGQPNHWLPPPPPPPPPGGCRPGSYSCTTTNNGWRVCDYSGHWVFAGYCSWGTTCKFNYQNGSPYCLPRY
ncbi:hypothetical protein C8A00DRAFT_43942 [Chaetomidium leptoderma]|uniref:Uncharacterized protein n=1 Tax=Chaetomidium leptoderma TaxID=669021 RepID=A0AAN6VKA9_9PEZI|nr:hypothetical protein C8A00DRAFT_43942 [Chaetomidium leptoderma]